VKVRDCLRTGSAKAQAQSCKNQHGPSRHPEHKLQSRYYNMTVSCQSAIEQYVGWGETSLEMWKDEPEESGQRRVDLLAPSNTPGCTPEPHAALAYFRIVRLFG
jgi:hypothetical protein